MTEKNRGFSQIRNQFFGQQSIFLQIDCKMCIRDRVGTMYSTKAKGVRYMEMAEGYVTSLALDENDEVIGYRFVKLGKMLEDIRHGVTPNEAYEKNMGQYGRYDGAAKYIDPREE